jgi:tetratricopeptide (TPR) repeat protein
MDELADLIAKIRLDQKNIVISRSSLQEIIHILDDQNSHHITLEAFLQFIFDSNIGHGQTTQSPFKTPPESPFPENLESPLFNFRTPMKPFTPFPIHGETPNVKNNFSASSKVARDGPFSISLEENTLPTNKNSPYPKAAESKSVSAQVSAEPSQATTNGSWFWGKESPGFAPSFEAESASSKTQTVQDENGPFSFNSWKQFKFDLGTTAGAKKPLRGTSKSNKDSVSPSQSQKGASTSFSAAEMPNTSRTEESRDIPSTSRSSDSTFKVHSVRVDEPLHTLTEDTANSSDTPSTKSGKSQSTTSTFTHYVFQDLPDTMRSALDRKSADENDSDEDSEMSVDDMRSPFAFSTNKPSANAQKENKPSNSLSSKISETEKVNKSVNSNNSNDFNKFDGPTEIPLSEEKDDAKAASDSNGNHSEDNHVPTVPFGSESVAAQFAGLNLGSYQSSYQSGIFSTSIRSSLGLSFNLGSGTGISSSGNLRSQHAKKSLTKKKEQGKSSVHSSSSTGSSTQSNSFSASSTAAGFFQTSPFVPAADASTVPGPPDTTDSEKTSENSNKNTSDTSSSMPAGDAPPAWWSAYQERPTSAATETSRTLPSQQPKEYQFPSQSEEPKESPAEESEIPTASSADSSSVPPSSFKGESFDKTLLDILDVYSKQGKQWYSMGQYDKALEAYSNCLNIAPKDWIGRATVTGNRAAVNFMMNRYMESVDDCDDALGWDPTLVKLHIRKGKALIRLGHFNPADSAFWKILQLNMNEFKDIVADEDYLIQLEQTLTSAKLEAQAGMREVVKLKESMNKLISAEAKKEYQEVFKIAEDILNRAPFARNAIDAKARALCELQRFESAKEFIEDTILSYPANLRAVHAHPSASATCPLKADLQWTEVKQPPSVVFSLPAVMQLALSMGSTMALIYVQVLKNNALSKNYSADVMQKMFALLEMLSNNLPAQDLLDTWSWVPRETAKLRELLSLKQTADQQFKEKSYRAAMQAYTQALRMDISAKRWNAILHCNRAACHLCLTMYSEAVHDCNTAIHLYADYHRAYLRRARAYRAMDKYHESVRDFRRYLCSDPVPSDFAEVQKELDGMLEEKAAEARRQKQQEQEQERRKQEQQRSFSAKNNSSAQFSQENQSQ